jgi:hypothetical protein
MLTSVDLVRRVVEARRVHCQQDTPHPPHCVEPAHTALPPTTVDATVEGRGRGCVWRFIKRRKTTEPHEEAQEQSATEQQTRKWCLCCFR